MKTVLALVAAISVVVVADPVLSTTEVDARPWPQPVIRVAALGRTHAAADVLWLKTVQIVGGDQRATAGVPFPFLEQWIDVITQLDPSFEDPYYVGAALLVTDDKRTDAVDALLGRAEQNFPLDATYPMLRGFLHQFGKLDPGTAAQYYRRAASKAGAPTFLAAHAARLELESHDCSHVLSDLAQLSAASSPSLRALFQARGTDDLLERCVAGMIRRAAVRYRLQNNKAATLEALISAGSIAAPPSPPGRCWHIKDDVASLGPCP
jgi:hypothetical protein